LTDHTLVICPRCNAPQKPLKPVGRRWWRRFLPKQTASRPVQPRCATCGEKLRAAQERFEASPLPSDQPGLLAVRCGHCQARTNYRPAHSGRCIRCASCSEPLTLP